MSDKKFKVRSIDVWAPEREPIVYGVIEGFQEMEVETKKGKESRQTMVIDTGLSRMRIWKSTALDEAFELGDVGDGIRLEYKGTQPLKGGQTFKRISVSVWESGDIEDVKRENERARLANTSEQDSP